LPRTFEYRVECIKTPGEAQTGLDIVINLHKKRWTGGRRSEAFHSDSVIAFHREFVDLAAQRGWLRLIVLHLNEQQPGRFTGCTTAIRSTFTNRVSILFSASTVLESRRWALAIQSAIQEGAHEYDFLHGDEEYKFHWAHETRRLMRIELHPPQTWARIYKRAMGCNRVARQMARRVLERASNVALSR
jgi:CelD/BcsL family acetyltransferase involved in cellulose biosynthesis